MRVADGASRRPRAFFTYGDLSMPSGIARGGGVHRSQGGYPREAAAGFIRGRFGDHETPLVIPPQLLTS
jgi:hypothetical protein